MCSLAQSCPALRDPVDCSPPGSSVHGDVHGDAPGKNIGVGCQFLFQGIFLTQELNSGLWHLLHWYAGSSPLESPLPNSARFFSDSKKPGSHDSRYIYLLAQQTHPPDVANLLKLPAPPLHSASVPPRSLPSCLQGWRLCTRKEKVSCIFNVSL